MKNTYLAGLFLLTCGCPNPDPPLSTDTGVAVESDCADSVDNDSDALTDCADADCASAPECAGGTATGTATGGTGTATGTTSGTPTTLGNVLINDLTRPYCLAERWLYKVVTDAPTNGTVIVNSWVTADPTFPNEEHDLAAFGDGTTIDNQHLGLLIPITSAEYHRNSGTAFVCGDHNVNPVMTHVYRVYDVDGNYSSCTVYTTNFPGLPTVFDGTANADNPVTDMFQITEANCDLASFVSTGTGTGTGTGSTP